MEVRDTRSGHDGLVLGSSSDVREYHPLSLPPPGSKIYGVRRMFDRSELSTVVGIYSRTFCWLVAGYFTKPRTGERIFSF